MSIVLEESIQSSRAENQRYTIYIYMHVCMYISLRIIPKAESYVDSHFHCMYVHISLPPEPPGSSSSSFFYPGSHL